jgi:glycosyltransferase involved in cell wall biosynthesis
MPFARLKQGWPCERGNAIMIVSIITPCLNGRDDLPLAVASLVDQAGVMVEHIVSDGGSLDGTREWLDTQPQIRWFSAPDRGLYDALNKGLARAVGDIFGYLNCDEQYLPGALFDVVSFFDEHPDVDLVYGDMLVVGRNGQLLAFRKSYPLRLPYVLASHLYVPSCAMFWRRRIADSGIQFDARWRAQGDTDFILRVMQSGFKTMHLPRYLAAFTLGKNNLGNRPLAQDEMLQARRQAPWWIRCIRWGWNGARLIEKALAGAYRQKFPMDYAIFIHERTGIRTSFSVHKGSFRWPKSGKD